MFFTLAGHLPILCWRAVTGTIDSLLVSAQKQDALFDRKGLTEKYVVSGA